MNSIINLTPGQLRRAASIQEKIQSLQMELNQILGLVVESASRGAVRKRRMSAAGRAAIGAAARARWAKINGTAPQKRKMSAVGLANIRAAQKARWAAIKGQKPVAKPVRKRKFSAAGKAALSAVAKARWAKAAGRSRL